MSGVFLGIPLVVWGVLCLVLAFVWSCFWPKALGSGATGLRRFLLRWGHALVWLLLGAMCFLIGSSSLARFAGPTGIAALVVYLAFLGATLRTRGAA